MYIEFKTLKFKNINSYGNKLTSFNFKDGLNSISGENGQGKSTILDALCFCLYGVPYRKIKINELINRTNKKDLHTTVLFNIDKDRYRITRGLSPNILEIEKNNSLIELLSTKRLTQEEIDKILGVDVTLFRQIISLAINANKPFLTLSSPDKRNIIETIFNIKVFGIMLKTVKQNVTGIKSDHKINERTLAILESNLKESMKQIKDIENTQENFEQDKQKSIIDLEQKIVSIEKSLENSNTNIDFGKEAIKKEKKKTFIYTTEDKQILDQDVGKLEYKIKKAKKDLKFFKDNDICPVCDAEFKDGEKDVHELKLRGNISKSRVLLKEHDVRTIEIDNDINKKEKQLKRIDKIKHAIKLEQNAIKINEDVVANYRSTLEETKDKKFTLDVDSIKQSFEDKKTEYKRVFKKTSNLEKELNIHDSMNSILGTEGIKSHFFSKLIPILNKKINEYLDVFDLPITLTFNDLMEETVYMYGNPNNQAPYLSFSAGEMKRIDIAILLSFIETTKLISNWSSNVIIFDELLDTSTDTKAMNKIMESIKQMTIDDPKLCLYIISHRDLEVNFNNKYNLKKIGGFSTIKEEKSK